MANKTIVCIYTEREKADQAIDDLIAEDYERSDIGLALDRTSGEALLAVTVAQERMDQALEIIRRYTPRAVDTRDTGWRQENFRDLYPNAEDFTAVQRAEKGQQDTE
jgi:hypothetical protein